MKPATLMMMLCAVLSLSACARPTERDGPRFAEIQRAPPPLAPETADMLVRTERDFAVWLVETDTNCATFGCRK